MNSGPRYLHYLSFFCCVLLLNKSRHPPIRSSHLTRPSAPSGTWMADCHANGAPGLRTLIRRASHFTGLCFLNSDELSGGDWERGLGTYLNARSLWCLRVSGAGRFDWLVWKGEGTGVRFPGTNQVPHVSRAWSEPFSLRPLHLDSVRQCLLLDATYGLSFSKGLSALGLEPHLLLLLLHKQRGSWHVQRVSVLLLTLRLCYFLVKEIVEALKKHSSVPNFRF